MRFEFETNELIGNIFNLVTSINKSNNLTARVLPRTGEQSFFIVEIENFDNNGCDYCNTKRIESMIGYQYMSYCPRCGKKLEK